MESVIIEWNGVEVPQGLQDLPPGRYVVEALDAPLALTPEEDAGLRKAMDDMEAGRGRPLEEAFSRIRTSLNLP